MATVLLVAVVVLVLAGLAFGVMWLLTGDDAGLSDAEPDGRALPLPTHRSLTELDLRTVRFDVGLRGYRMDQVDRVLRRTAYDLGYKDEMIAVLGAEVAALREGRTEDAELLRKARESAQGATGPDAPSQGPRDPVEVTEVDQDMPQDEPPQPAPSTASAPSPQPAAPDLPDLPDQPVRGTAGDGA